MTGLNFPVHTSGNHPVTILVGNQSTDTGAPVLPRPIAVAEARLEWLDLDRNRALEFLFVDDWPEQGLHVRMSSICPHLRRCQTEAVTSRQRIQDLLKGCRTRMVSFVQNHTAELLGVTLSAVDFVQATDEGLHGCN